MKRKGFKVLLILLCLLGAFEAGMRFQAHSDEETCRSLGGKNIGDYPFCVLDADIRRAREASGTI